MLLLMLANTPVKGSTISVLDACQPCQQAGGGLCKDKILKLSLGEVFEQLLDGYISTPYKQLKGLDSSFQLSAIDSVRLSYSIGLLPS